MPANHFYLYIQHIHSNATDGLPVVLSIKRRAPTKNVLQEAPMNALHQRAGVPFRHFGVIALTGSVTAGRVRALPAEMLQHCRAVRAHAPWFLDRSTLLTAVLANQAVRAAIEEDLAEAETLDEQLDLRVLPEPARTGPLEGNDTTT